MDTVYCPLDKKTGCGYWACFGGHLDPFIKAFKKHVRKDHDDRPYGDTRDVGGLIDRWIGDVLIAQEARPDVPLTARRHPKAESSVSGR
jgi:hypothetical protein